MKTPFAASSDMAKRKRTQYEGKLKDMHPNYQYQPIIFESAGAMPKEATNLVHKLSLFRPEFPGATWASRSPSVHMMQTISILIARGNSQVMRNTIRLNFETVPGYEVGSVVWYHHQKQKFIH